MGHTNAFETEFRKSLELWADKHPNFAWHRLFDTMTFRQVSENIFATKNPCDFIAMRDCANGDSPMKHPVFYMLECKSSHSNSSFCLDYIKPHQITLMSQWVKAGAEAYFIINNRAHPGKHEAFPIPVEHVEIMVESGIKSIKWATLRENYTSLVKIPKGDGAWDLSPLIG